MPAQRGQRHPPAILFTMHPGAFNRATQSRHQINSYSWAGPQAGLSCSKMLGPMEGGHSGESWECKPHSTGWWHRSTWWSCSDSISPQPFTVSQHRRRKSNAHDKMTAAQKHQSTATSHQQFKGLMGSYLYLLTKEIKKTGSRERNNKTNAHFPQNSKHTYV